MESLDAILNELDRVEQEERERFSSRIRALIDELRGALPSEDESVLSLDPIRAQVEAVREEHGRLRQQLSTLESEATAPETPAGVVSLDLLRELDAKRSQSEILHAMLPVLAEHVARAVVLVLREGRVSAWSGVGLSDAERLRLWTGEPAASPALERLTENVVVCSFDPSEDPVFSTWLAGEPTPSQALLVPVVLRGRLVGAVYLDRVDGQPWRPEPARGLVALSGLLIDTLAYRKTVPSPPLSEPVTVELEPTEAEESFGGPEGEPEEASADVGSDAESMADAQVDPSATVRIDSATAETESVEVTPPPEVPEPPAAEPEEEPEEEAEGPAHEEARRFARLLVSEIKLYNEDEVERGREQNSIYQLLKEDIDRSREMYEQRVAPEVLDSRDYFYEELVRILAEGDEDALGM